MKIKSSRINLQLTACKTTQNSNAEEKPEWEHWQPISIQLPILFEYNDTFQYSEPDNRGWVRNLNAVTYIKSPPTEKRSKWNLEREDQEQQSYYSITNRNGETSKDTALMFIYWLLILSLMKILYEQILLWYFRTSSSFPSRIKSCRSAYKERKKCWKITFVNIFEISKHSLI